MYNLSELTTACFLWFNLFAS